ncbi:DUF3885 domain-containing protein [Paenibacillus sp. PL91]|uniref:DUF3885 domain-containing protein n=1 Tax=Paenibacillus sp. PL91 TaxID=2729538 RepID=UPI00145DCD2E|nr:DUF3885 domain-containing protein [Paenibacillus sp. PL91]MBC9205089.1 DUF3885 domain-containing protein [Paenibacillus sp. PL91]
MKTSVVNNMFKQKYWIRFELGPVGLEEKAYVNEVMKRSNSICNFLFSKNDEVHVINRISYLNEKSKHEKLDMHRFFKTKQTVKHLEHQVIPYEYEDDEQMVTSEYRVRVKFEDIRMSYLLTALANQDFGRKPRVHGNVMLFNSTKQILLYIYDDRGCDVYGVSKESLLPLYHQYRSWILDYDRIHIDNVFEEGLAGVFETETERSARQYANELKVQSTDINLYSNNTCHISHLLEIPNDQSKQFEEEIGGTGFTLRLQSKDQDTSVYQVTKTEALALINYQSELMNLYSKKYGGVYCNWEIARAF